MFFSLGDSRAEGVITFFVPDVRKLTDTGTLSSVIQVRNLPWYTFERPFFPFPPFRSNGREENLDFSSTGGLWLWREKPGPPAISTTNPAAHSATSCSATVTPSRPRGRARLRRSCDWSLSRRKLQQSNVVSRLFFKVKIQLGTKPMAPPGGATSKRLDSFWPVLLLLVAPPGSGGCCSTVDSSLLQRSNTCSTTRRTIGDSPTSFRSR